MASAAAHRPNRQASTVRAPAIQNTAEWAALV
jgi:hypothetical protein